MRDSDDPINELVKGAETRVLYTALLAALQASEHPVVSAKHALSAVEYELVELLNTPQQLGPYLDAYQEQAELLNKFLHARFDGL